MPNYTTNLGLEKPLGDEQYNIDVFNANADKIDQFAGQVPPRALIADELKIARKINGVDFKGDQDITLPTMNTSGDQTINGTKTFANTIQGTADKALKDGNGDVIADTYLKVHGEWKHALKGYEDAGELLTDAEGLSDVIKFAHSTFDISKFTVTGSPTITSDGIASGFSNSGSYLQPTGINVTAGDNYIFQGEVTITDLTTIQSMFGIKGLTADSVSIVSELRYDKDNKRLLLIYKNLSGTPVNKEISMPLNSVTANTSYVYKVVVNGSNITFIVNGETIGTSSTFDNLSSEHINFGRGYSGGSPTLGTCDLKQFYIVKNNIPVFSGNKTGVDTIKPDNYTVVGTPTISNDGVLSGLSSGNYVSTTIPQYGNDFVFKAKFKTGSSTTSTQREYILRSTNFSVYFQQYNSAYYIPAIEIKDETNTNYLRSSANNWTASADTEYEIECGYNSTTHYIYIKIWETLTGTLVHTVTNTLTTNVADISSFTNIAAAIGSNENGTNNFWPSDIDLNGIKTYSNGSLASQPCLKIPYNISKTGSKVVYSVYRGRVNDMAQQFGYAPYHTLDELNKDYTLPQSELYGIIGNCLDTKYPKQTEKDTIIDWMMPDWSRLIAQNLTAVDGETGAATYGYNSYTATKKGWVQAYGTTPQAWVGLYVNGVIVAGTQASATNDNTGYAGCVPVNVGDIYYATSAYSGALNFLPCKGEI